MEGRTQILLTQSAEIDIEPVYRFQVLVTLTEKIYILEYPLIKS